MTTHEMSAVLREAIEVIKDLGTKLETVTQGIEEDDAWHTVLGFARLNAHAINRETALAIGIRLSEVCRSRGIEPRKVRDDRFTWVNAYPRAILEEYHHLFVSTSK